MMNKDLSALISFFLMIVTTSDSARMGWHRRPLIGDGSGQFHDFDDIDGRHSDKESANPGEFPFFVQWGDCSASLIHSDILLTAAHCQPIGSDDVLVGAHTQRTVEGYPINSVQRKIVERRVHPLWDSQAMEYDFMVLRLDEKVNLTPVVLQSVRDGLDDGQPLTVLGFGSTQPRIEVNFNQSNFEFSVQNPFDAMQEAEYFETDDDSVFTKEVLQKRNVSYVDPTTCHDVYDGFVQESVMLCAGRSDAGENRCFGDSGGPLIRQFGGSYVQVGVVSFSDNCTQSYKPGVYSRVSAAYAWIVSQLCNMTASKPEICFTASSPSPAPTRQEEIMDMSSSPSLSGSKFPSGIMSGPPSNIPSRNTIASPPTAIYNANSREQAGDDSSPLRSSSDLSPAQSPSPTSFPLETRAQPSLNPVFAPSASLLLALLPSAPTRFASDSEQPSSPAESPSPTSLLLETRAEPSLNPVFEPSASLLLALLPSAPTTFDSDSAQPSSSAGPSSPFHVLSDEPSVQPSHEPSLSPSFTPSTVPSIVPSPAASDEPSLEPSYETTLQPSFMPSSQPSFTPSTAPSSVPSTTISDQPSLLPSREFSSEPSFAPSVVVSDEPSLLPSREPTFEPSE